MGKGDRLRKRRAQKGQPKTPRLWVDYHFALKVELADELERIRAKINEQRATSPVNGVWEKPMDVGTLIAKLVIRGLRHLSAEEKEIREKESRIILPVGAERP